MNKSLYDYFHENNDEILHLQYICFSIPDILFIISLVEKDRKKFQNLSRYDFLIKTVERIKNEDNKLDSELSKDPKKIKFFIIYKDEKNSQLERLMHQNEKGTSTFISGNQDADLIFERVKFCIKTVLKGLNLLNNKDFNYLNNAVTSDKFFIGLKYTLDEIGEFSKVLNKIPLKLYGQYISNNKKKIEKSYKVNDFEKLYDEIYKEESESLNELRSFTPIIITKDGMNLRCTEKILEKERFDLNHIEQAKKFVKIEKFVESKKIEVCVQIKEGEEKSKLNTLIGPSKKQKAFGKKDDDKKNEEKNAIYITEASNCPHKIY